MVTPLSLQLRASVPDGVVLRNQNDIDNPLPPVNE